MKKNLENITEELMMRYLEGDLDSKEYQEFEEIMSLEHGIDFEDKGFNEPFDDAGKPETPWPPRAQGASPPVA